MAYCHCGAPFLKISCLSKFQVNQKIRRRCLKQSNIGNKAKLILNVQGKFKEFTLFLIISLFQRLFLIFAGLPTYHRMILHRRLYGIYTVCFPEIRELQRSIETYDMRYFPQHVLLCTSAVYDQSGYICIQGYLRILWSDRKHKIFKNRQKS